MAVIRFQRLVVAWRFLPRPSLRSWVSSSTEDQTAGRNWVGPPHPVSNLRLIKYGTSTNESAAQKELRQRRNDVQNWNQKFWEQHNASFEQLKAEYVKKLMENGRTESPSADEMSKFYKRFLENNRLLHASYNNEWYKKNIGLLWPAVKVVADGILRKLGLITGSGRDRLR